MNKQNYSSQASIDVSFAVMNDELFVKKSAGSERLTLELHANGELIGSFVIRSKEMAALLLSTLEQLLND